MGEFRGSKNFHILHTYLDSPLILSILNPTVAEKKIPAPLLQSWGQMWTRPAQRFGHSKGCGVGIGVGVSASGCQVSEEGVVVC